MVSGVIAQSRSGKHERTRNVKGAESDASVRAFTFRTGLDNALLEARGRLTTSEVTDFFKNFQRLIALEVARFSKVPIGFAHLQYLRLVPEKSLKFELNWLAERVQISAETINAFLCSRSEIEQFILNGDFELAEQVLTQLEAVYGSSLWSTSLGIAIAQERLGDDAQKQLATEIRKRYPKGALPFLVRNWSQRAERSVPIGWYLENAAQRLGAMADGEIKIYLSHKVLGEWPASHKSISTILRIEQNHHLFDMYETLISALQHLAVNSYDRSLRTQVATALGRMRQIKDFRLSKLATCMGIASWPHQAVSASTDVTNLLATGATRAAYAADRKSSIGELRSGFTCLVRSLILSSAERPRLARKQMIELESRISLGLIAQADPLRFSDDVDVDAAKKIGHLYSMLPSGLAARITHAALNASSADNHFTLLRLAALNFEHESFIDVAVNSGSKSVSDAYLARVPASATRSLAEIFGGKRYEGSEDIEPSAASYAAACAAHQASNYDEVEVKIISALQSRSVLISNASTTLALSAYGANGNLAPAATLISTELAIKGRSPDSLPIKSALDQLKWSEVAPYASDIAMSNAFAALSDIEPTDKTRTMRTFALQAAMKNLGVEKPSKVRDIAKSSRTPEFVYFLYRACSTDVLDMVSSLTSSRAVLEERREIYSALVELNPAREEEYRYQVLTISKEIRISQGRQTIDASRVHVDIAALRPIIRRDLMETYSRYAQLVREEGPSESLDELLRGMAKPENLAKQLLAASDSESDVLLILMMRQARERYLFNVPHGLDSYLSKRVRHGSIVGHLRAPVEAEGMITQQHSDGSYKENSKWAHVINAAKEPDEIAQAFHGFAKSLDQYLLRLKDVLLHVRSDERPLGIFDIKFHPIQYRLIRAVASRDQTVETFLETVFATLRGLLNVSLQTAHNQIKTEASRRVGELFNQLRVAILNSVLPGSDRVDLIGALNRASSGAQAAVTSAANWFVPAEIENVKFAMDVAFEIAMNSVRSITPEFEPDVEFQDETGLQFSVQQLPVVQDVLFDVLGNVAKHSNLVTPRVCIKTSYDTKKELLKLYISNQIAKDRDIASLHAKLDDMRPQLRDLNYLARARTEGKSGIAKLASTVFQSELGALDFYVNEHSEFVLELALSVQLEQ